MHFQSFHWLSQNGVWAIVPCSTNMATIDIIFLGHFYFSLVLGGVFNKTIVPLVLVGYKIIIAYSMLRVSGWLFTISHPMRAHGIIVN